MPVIWVTGKAGIGVDMEITVGVHLKCTAKSEHLTCQLATTGGHPHIYFGMTVRLDKLLLCIEVKKV